MSKYQLSNISHSANEREWSRKFRRYGITEKEYYAIVGSQNSLCPVCSKSLNGYKVAHIDHCHKTNKIRGILCRDCNIIIGNAKDSPEILRRMANYLKKHQ